MPRVSVLMPVFNTAAFLMEAVQSIREQEFTDFELIAVNDGSTDESSDLLRSLTRQEPRMRLIERPNRGLITTRNELLSQARGEFIAWMDSDDLSHPDRLSLQVAAFDANAELVCVGTHVRLIDPKGHWLGFEEYPEQDRAIRDEQTRGSGLRFASTMQRRAIATRVGGFRHPFKMGEDLDFLLRVADRGLLANLPSALYVYRQHLLNTCSSLGRYWPEYRATILSLAEERRLRGSDKLQRGETIRLPQVDSSEVQDFRPIVLLDWARRALSVGDRVRALGYTLNAIRMSPLKQTGWRFLAKLMLLKS